MSMMVLAQQGDFQFDKTEHDFGQFNEGDGPVTTIFTFTNSGTAPIVLNNVQASCGCTTPQWPREPIEPGKTGEIAVTFNPSGRPGRFQKSITIQSNAATNPYRLYIRGYVLPKLASLTDVYKNKIGLLSVKVNSVDFGTIKKNASPAPLQQIEYANHSNTPLTVVPQIAGDDSGYLTVSTTHDTKEVGIKEVGTFNVFLNPRKCNLWGPVETDFLVIVNGDTARDDSRKIKVSFEIVDDVENMSLQDRMSAPIIDIPRTLDLGVVTTGQKIKREISYKNTGAHPLEIRRIICDDTTLSMPMPKKNVVSGKTGILTLNYLGVKQEAGKYSRLITLYTNDPDNAKITIDVTWEVR